MEDASGSFAWAAPGEALHAFVNELERPVGTYLYGRRMYETMASWETVDHAEDRSAASREFADIWRAAEKVVYSRTLDAVSTARTRIEREFDPVAVRALKESARHELTVGGAALAGQALDAGLVDELHLLLHPVLVGGGKRALPDGIHSRLELRSQRSFESGMVHLHYAVLG